LVLLDGEARTPWQAFADAHGGLSRRALYIGLDRRAPVSWDVFQKHGSFRYTGTIRSVTIEPGSRAPDSAVARG